jgi:hypothetical protein
MIGVNGLVTHKEWNEDQIKFMEWLCLPGDDLMGEGKGLRHPKTIRELPVLSGKADNSQASYTKAVGMIRELPLDQREIFLSILDNLFSQSSEPQAVPRHISVRKVYTGEEPAPAQELPALPAPLASVDTTLDTPRYDPSRGVRKPVRKPR